MFFIRIALTALIGCNFIQIFCTISDTTCSLLNQHEKITDIKAFECYKQYEAKLKDKSQKELDSCLQQRLKKPLQLKLSRPKLVALIYAGAHPSYAAQEGNIDKFIYYVLFHNDIPLMRYALEQKFIDPNHKHLLLGLPALWQCTSSNMANIFLKRGADITKTGVFNENIVHHLCSNPYRMATNLIHFYSTVHPKLIHGIDNSGKTPLLRILDSSFGKSLDDFRRKSPIVYTLLNLGSKKDVYSIQGDYAEKIPYEIIITKAAEVNDAQLKQELLNLAAYMLRPPKIKSTLFQRLMDAWHDKFDA